MTRRYEQTGRDSWLAQAGYQHSPRVPGPIASDKPSIWPTVWWFASRTVVVALPFIIAALAIVAFSGE